MSLERRVDLRKIYTVKRMPYVPLSESGEPYTAEETFNEMRRSLPRYSQPCASESMFPKTPLK